MNMVEHFKNEMKKSKGHPNITFLKKYTKATGKTGCVVKTIRELAGLLLMYCILAATYICQSLKVCIIT